MAGMVNQNGKLRIFLTGVGGQGTLLASRLLGEAALAALRHMGAMRGP